MQKPLNLKQSALLLAPMILIISMYFAFQGLNERFGFPTGFILGFVIYWVGWCILFPAWILGGFKKIFALMQDRRSLGEINWKTQLALWIPPVIAFFVVFLPQIHEVSFQTLLVSVLLGLIIGFTEEIFWRGAYIAMFPDNTWWNTIYPSLTFGLWHACPQSAFPGSMTGGLTSFVIYSIILGFLYAYYARQAHSIRWSIVSHVILNSFGLGGLAYLAWLKLP